MISKTKKNRRAVVVLAAAITVGTVTPIKALPTVPNKGEKSGIQVERIGGKDRIETSLKIADRIGAKKAYVVSADTFADAISVGSIAAKNNDAIVLTRDDQNLGKTLSGMGVGTAIVVGGENSVSSSVYNEIDSSIATTQRIAGSNRYNTSKKLVESTGKKDVGVATGRDFPDALTSGPLLAKKDIPLMLVDGRNNEDLPSGIKGSYTFGGTMSVKQEYGKRLSGKDRYETAEKIAEEMGKYDTVVLASGTVYADALSATSLANKLNAPILLSKKNVMTKTTKDLIKKVKKVVIVGGEGSISDEVVKEIKNISINDETKDDTTKPDTTKPDTTKPDITKPERPQAKITGIKINPQEVSITKGDSQVFSAQVEGENLTEPDKEVIWSLVGEHSQKTKIENGKLTVSPDEIATNLKVRVVSKKDSVKGATATVKLKNAPKVTNIKITSNIETIKVGEKVIMRASVEGNDTLTEKTVKWSITGASDVTNTKIDESTGELTLGKDETAESITVIATSKFDHTKKAEKIIKIKSVTSMTIFGDDSVEKGKGIQLTAKVEGKNLEEADKAVEWKMDTYIDGVTIDENGLLTVNSSVKSYKVVIKAVSKFDSSKISLKEVLVIESLKPYPTIKRDSYIQYMSFTSDDQEWLKAIKDGKAEVMLGEKKLNISGSEYAGGEYYFCRDDNHIISVKVRTETQNTAKPVKISVSGWPDVNLKYDNSTNHWLIKAD